MARHGRLFPLLLLVFPLIGALNAGIPIRASASPVTPAVGSGVIASGTLLVSGAPATNGTVVAFAWPNQQRLLHAKKGSRLALVRVGSVNADSHGNFAIASAPGVLPAGVLSSGNLVNLELIAVSGGKEMHYRYSSEYATGKDKASPHGWVIRSNGADSPWARPDFRLDFGRQTAMTVGNDPRQWIGSNGAILGSGIKSARAMHNAAAPETRATRELVGSLQNRAGASAPLSVSPDSCWTVPQTIYYDKKEHFVTTETMSGIPETVTESASARHTLGVAYKSAYGGWGASGSMSMTRSGSVSVSQTKSTSHTIFNRVNYRDYDMWCGSGTFNGTYRQPYSFYDLLTNDGTGVGESWFYNCGHHSAGQTWDTGSATNATYSAGVTLQIADLSAQSGYGASLNLHYKFTTAGQVCGNNSAGPANSSKVEADTYG